MNEEKNESENKNKKREERRHKSGSVFFSFETRVATKPEFTDIIKTPRSTLTSLVILVML